MTEYKTKNVNGVDIDLTSEEVAELVARDVEWAAGAAARELETARQMRAMAFSSEADALGLKVIRGEATKEEYLAKVAEIRARFPYPEPK